MLEQYGLELCINDVRSIEGGKIIKITPEIEQLSLNSILDIMCPFLNDDEKIDDLIVQLVVDYDMHEPIKIRYLNPLKGNNCTVRQFVIAALLYSIVDAYVMKGIYDSKKTIDISNKDLKELSEDDIFEGTNYANTVTTLWKVLQSFPKSTKILKDLLGDELYDDIFNKLRQKGETEWYDGNILPYVIDLSKELDSYIEKGQSSQSLKP